MEPENIQKLSFTDVEKIITDYHRENNIHYNTDRKDHPIMVFRGVADPVASKWIPKDYTEKECTYEFNDTDKFWFSECIGNSLFASCLDENDSDFNGIRLDYYLGKFKWKYFYRVK